MRMNKHEFVHLHVHSEYSLLDGASRINELVHEAKNKGMKALAITDHGVMYGTIPFYKACRANNIQPIIGVEVYVTNQPLDKKFKKGEYEMNHLLLLAETYEGYQNLMKLTSKAHLEGFYYKPRVTKQWLEAHHRGLICLSACLAGEVQQALLHNETEKAKQIVDEHQRIFGKQNYFLELQDHGMPEQKKVNARLIQLSKEMDAPLVVTNDVHYTYAKDAVAHDCLLCIGTAKKVDDSERLKFPSNQFYLKSPEEMRTLFPHVEEAYLNTVRIAERCQVDIPLGQEILPEYPVPDGHSAISYLREQCEKGLEQRYEQVTEDIKKRLNYELGVIEQMGYADYFLIVWDFMAYAHEQGIMTGPGRGSAAGSLVAYVLKITNIDPVKYNLLFERFLNPERVTMPDIDIDFSDQRRDEVIDYVCRKYGKDRVAQIITFGTLGAKACVRDVGRAFGVPITVVDQIAKCIPSGPNVTLKKALEASEQLQQMAQTDENVKRILQTAMQLEGLARHTSTHAAGVVISKEALTNYVPLQTGHDEVALTQYPMEDLEALGLLKMDFLGLRNLSLMEEILRIVNQNRAKSHPLHLEDIPYNDEKTYKLLSAGDTAGVFQLESEGMKQVLKRLKPNTFEDIIAVLALYRPGPMQNIPLFIQAKHGQTKVDYPHEDLKPILQDTYGIIVYQEQIMQIASIMAGFSLGEADLLRRAVSKKKRDVLEEERAHFVKGCLAQGYDESIANHVYDLIVRFADYGFNRSHSAAYAVIAYQLAYLKAHYPVAFLASLLSMNMGDQAKIADYMNQAARRNIEVLRPSVLYSGPYFSVENGKIRFGLTVIKNVGIQAIKEIINERQKGPFKNLLDFCQRVNLRVCNRRVIESLILAGAMDDFDMHRAQALANLDDILEMAEQAQGLKASDQLFFFADELPDDYEWTDVQRYTSVEQLKYEKEVLGFYLSGHPLDPFRESAHSYKCTEIPHIEGMKHSIKLRTFGYINKVKRIKTKKGEAMAFVQLEDNGVEVDTVVFPNVFKQQPTLYEVGNMVFVEAKLEIRDDKKQLIIEKAIDLRSIPKKEAHIEETTQSPTLKRNEAVHNENRGEEQLNSGEELNNEKIDKDHITTENKKSEKINNEKVNKQYNNNEEIADVYIKISESIEHSPRLKLLQHTLQEFNGPSRVYLYYERLKKTIVLGEEYNVNITEELLIRLKRLVKDDNAVKIKMRS